MRTVVGLLTVYLDVFEAASLKDKRRVVRSVTARLRDRFNVAVAEVDSLDARANITLGIACVSNSERHAQSQCQKIVRRLERMRMDAALIDYEIELL